MTGALVALTSGLIVVVSLGTTRVGLTQGVRRTVWVALVGVAWHLVPIAAVCCVGLLVLRRFANGRGGTGRAQVTSLEDVVDLLALASSSGCTPQQAVREVAAVLPMRDEAFVQAVREIDAGERFGAVLDRLRSVLGPPAAPLVAALVSAAEFGTQLAPALALISHEARLAARRSAEQRARRIPVLLLLPLVLCILPAFVLLTIVPLLLATVADLSS